MALVQGMAETRAALGRWRRRPAAVLGQWLAVSLGIAVALLVAVYVLSTLQRPDPTPLYLPGVHYPADLGDAAKVLYRNSLVLALHALACVAGFIAGSSLPQQARHKRGLSRKVHEHAGPLAIAFVACATAFSLCTQAYVLGSGASTLAYELGLSRLTLLLSILPHALPELVALFLPLAAWLVASRRGAWEELLAATFVTLAIAVPVLVAAALVEAFVTPRLIVALAT